MDATRLTFGTIKIESKGHSLTLGISLPFFMAEQLNGQMVPEDWEDIIAEQVYRGRDVTIWSGRFDFPGIDEQPSKGSKGTSVKKKAEETAVRRKAERIAMRRKT